MLYPKYIYPYPLDLLQLRQRVSVSCSEFNSTHSLNLFRHLEIRNFASNILLHNNEAPWKEDHKSAVTVYKSKDDSQLNYLK